MNHLDEKHFRSTDPLVGSHHLGLRGFEEIIGNDRKHIGTLWEVTVFLGFSDIFWLFINQLLV